MKRYMTWHEYVTKYPRPKRYDCDTYSKTIAQQYAAKICNCTCTYFSTSVENNSCDFDMYNNLTGRKFVCELKDRWSFKSTDYNDHIFEKKKLNGLLRKIKNGEGERIALFSIYDDGVLKVTANVLDQLIGFKQTYAPNTTALEDHTYINKNFVLVKPQALHYIYILDDDEEKDKTKFSVLFFDKPQDVKKLNEQLEQSEKVQALF